MSPLHRVCGGPTHAETVQREGSQPVTQLLKDMFDLAIFPVISEIEEKMLLLYADIVEYRS